MHAATDVKSGFRIGVIALTETRLVFIRKKKGREFIDREFSRDAISSSTLKKHFGSWQLSVGDNRTSSIFVGQLDELEPFVEPLRQSASANESRRIEEQRLADSHAHPEVSDEPEPEGMYDGHDTTIIGEHLLLIAKSSAGFGSGVLVLTEDRLVYVRKKKDKTFVDREFDRSAIVDVTYSKSLGSWTLGFKDGSKLLFYNQNDDDLEPFVAPLRRNAAANETRRIEEQRLANSHAHPEVSDEPGPECKYDGHDTTVTGSRALLLAKASAGFGSGVLVLTEDRLVYLRKKKGETYIDRDTDRAAISEFETKPFLNSVDLRFKDRGNLVIFTPNNDDLEPFVDPLRASADANEAKRKEELREAEQRAREETAKREVENRARAEAEEKERAEAEANELRAIVGEPVLLTAKTSSGWGSGVIVLAKNRLVYLRKRKGQTFIDREMDRSEITSVEFELVSNIPTLAFQDKGNRIQYQQFKHHDDLEQFVEPLRQSAKRNAQRFFHGHDLRIVGEPPLLIANGSLGSSSGVIVLTENRLIYLRKKKGETYIDRQSERSAITNVDFELHGNTPTLAFLEHGKRISYQEIDGHPELGSFVDPLTQSAEENATHIINGFDLRVIDESASLTVQGSRAFSKGLLVLTKRRLIFLRKNKHGTYIDLNADPSRLIDIEFDK